MDTTLGRFDLYSVAATCPLKVLLLVLALNPSCMPWNAAYEAGACVPSLCLKYTVICIANALLATGWLVVSILSILGELIPRALGFPPTMPKFLPPPEHEASPLLRPKRPVGLRSPASQPSVPQDAAVRDGDVPQRVPPATPQTRDEPQASSSLTPARIAVPGVSDRARNGSASPERPSLVPLSLPGSGSDLQSSPSAEPPRGRKLGFIRRHLSGGRDPSKRPLSKRGRSLREIVTSPEHSPERPDRRAVKLCVKKCRSVEAVERAPVPRTDPYQAPYFFPSPLSPDARDYMSRVRSERVASPAAETKSRANVPTSPEVPHTPTSPPPQSTPNAQPEASTSQSPKVRPKAARRSWHISFKHDHHEVLERPPSWTSDTPTVISAGSHPGDASDAGHSSSPDAARRPSKRKQSPGQVLSPLRSLDISPLDRPQSSPIIPTLAKLAPRKSWNFAFRHRRTTSEASTASNATQPLSEHGVDELPKPRARPKPRRTTP